MVKFLQYLHNGHPLIHTQIERFIPDAQMLKGFLHVLGLAGNGRNIIIHNL